MTSDIDKVHDQLYVANIKAICEQSTPDDASAVVGVCQDNVGDNVGVEYVHFNMADGPHTGYGGDYSYEMFEDATRTILDYLQDGMTVVVHCHAGQSRSASTSIAALAVYEGTTYDEMYDVVESHRPQIQPGGLLDDHARRFVDEHGE